MREPDTRQNHQFNTKMNLPAKHQIVKCHYTKWQSFKHLHFVHRDPICVTHCYHIPPNIACVVYGYAPLSSRLRRLASPGIFNTGSRCEIAQRVNKNIRVILRVGVRKDLQGHHIGTKLIRKTLPLLKISYIEAYTNLFGASKCLKNAGMIRHMEPPSETWFQIEQLYKELDIPNTRDHTAAELFTILERLPAASKLYYRKIALKYLSTLRCFCKNWSLSHIHNELIARRDQNPFYFLWKNPKMDLTP